MRREIRNILFSIIAVSTLFLMMSDQSWAMIYSTDDFQLTGKFEAKAAFFTSDAQGNTYPQFKKWDMFKERNLLYLQADHNLQPMTGMDLQYHIVGRALYEGVYDYGAKVFQDAYKENKEAFDKYDLKYQFGIWEAYANYKKGPVTLRVGRQNLSWGETDILRVVDHINPLDNTWGGTGTESLDDRRIPLWMARLSFQYDPRLGIEGFLVPGSIDATVAPNTPAGSPYAPPLPRLDALIPAGITPGFNNSTGYVTEPSRNMDNSRYGLKISTQIFDTSIALSYQRTYWDSPAVRFNTDKPNIWLFNPGTLGIEMEYPKVHVFGLQASHIFTDLDLIVKGDVAHVQGAPVYITDINQPITFVGGILPMVTTGDYTYKDLTTFGISMERQFWIRPINNASRISFEFEYYGTFTHDYDERMTVPVPDPSGVPPRQLRYEQMMALVARSDWYGKTNLSIATLYDPRGDWMINPTLSYKFNNPLTVALSYSVSTGGWSSFGIGRDRDQVSVLLRYEF